MNRLFKSIIAILVLVLCIGMFSACVVHIDSGSFIYDDASLYTSGGATLTDKITSIDVEWVGGSVSVSTSDSSEVSFAETSSKELEDDTTMRYRVKDGVLYIKFAKSGILNSFLNLDKDLTVILPKSVLCDKIEISTVSSDINVKEVDAVKFKLESVSGRIDVKASSLDEFKVSTVSGKILAQLNCSTPKINAESVSGDIDILCVNPTNVDIQTVSGNSYLDFGTCPADLDCDFTSGSVTVSIPKDSSFSLDFESVSGKIYSDYFPNSDGDGKYTAGDGLNDFSIDSVSGDLTIK